MIRLRYADAGDEWFFLQLRNDPVAARFSRRPLVTKGEHSHWWDTTSDHRWVAYDKGDAVGTLRLSSDAMVSIVVVPERRGEGLGTEMLEALISEARARGYARIWAEVSPENAGSQRAFLKANYTPILFERSTG